MPSNIHQALESWLSGFSFYGLPYESARDNGRKGSGSNRSRTLVEERVGDWRSFIELTTFLSLSWRTCLWFDRSKMCFQKKVSRKQSDCHLSVISLLLRTRLSLFAVVFMSWWYLFFTTTCVLGPYILARLPHVIRPSVRTGYCMNRWVTLVHDPLSNVGLRLGFPGSTGTRICESEILQTRHWILSRNVIMFRLCHERFSLPGIRSGLCGDQHIFYYRPQLTHTLHVSELNERSFPLWNQYVTILNTSQMPISPNLDWNKPDGAKPGVPDSTRSSHPRRSMNRASASNANCSGFVSQTPSSGLEIVRFGIQPSHVSRYFLLPFQ
jgi:hypothetical protein